MTASVRALLDPLLTEAVEKAALLPGSQRQIEFVGLCLIAEAERVHLPQVGGDASPGRAEASSPEDEAKVLNEAVEAACTHVLSSGLRQSYQMAPELLRMVGEQLCPKAAPIPTDAYRTLYKKCNDIPYIVQVDAFLFYPAHQWHFSYSRKEEAKRQVWQLIRSMHDQGKCDRLVLMCGNPAVGKSTWIEQMGAQEPGVETCVFFDDLLNNRRRRSLWWEAYRASKLQLVLDVVAIVRDYDRSVASNEARGARGGIYVPSTSMASLSSEYEAPSTSEGYRRVRIYENQHDELTGEGSYVLRHEEHAATAPTL